MNDRAGYLSSCLAGAAALLLGLPSQGRAQPASPAGPPDLEFRLATTLLPKAQTQLIHGQQIRILSKDWTTVIVTPVIDERGVVRAPEERCTGSLVGPGVVLLAAHCLDQRDPKGVLRAAYFLVDAERVTMKCKVQPAYLVPPDAGGAAPRRSEDIALCFAAFARPHPDLAKMEFDVLDVAPVSRGDAILMTGYGCTDITTPSVMNKTLAIGDSVIGYPPDGVGIMGNYAMIGAAEMGQPALCPGDSGGPLYSGATTQHQDLPRRIRGVNSTFQHLNPGYMSRIAMLSSAEFRGWALTWVGQFKGAYICGLSDPKVATSCKV